MPDERPLTLRWATLIALATILASVVAQFATANLRRELLEVRLGAKIDSLGRGVYGRMDALQRDVNEVRATQSQQGQQMLDLSQQFGILKGQQLAQGSRLTLLERQVYIPYTPR